jgi:glycosyltransferase involved in cell wall biosynthesis
MKVAFVTTYDASDIGAWSGTIFNMRQSLMELGLDVETIDSLKDPYSAFFKAKRLVKNVVFRKNYLRDREPFLLRAYASEVAERLSRIDADLIFSPGTKPIAYLNTDKPIVFWGDATFACSETLRNGHAMEQAALTRCRLAIYASEWAANSAVKNYDVDPRKVKIVPYGANLGLVPKADDVRAAIASRDSDICRLILVGVDWHRKGGERALAVTTELNRRGIKAELWVAGCRPPAHVPAFVKRCGYLSKKDPEQSALLSWLYNTSDFLILPSEAEGFGVVIPEANAHGLPALATNVGGIRTAIADGRNGRVFDPARFVEQCTNYIVDVMSSRERYRQLCHSSLDEYSTRLNWHSAVKSVLKLIADDIGRR